MNPEAPNEKEETTIAEEIAQIVRDNQKDVVFPDIQKVELMGAEIVTIKGQKGDKGDKGDSIKGEQGIEGKNGKQGISGKDGKQGLKGGNGNDGLNGKDGKNGIDGLDGSPDSPDEIVSKLQGVEEQWLSIEAIKGDFNTKVNQVFSAGGTNGLPEAPQDNKQYARKDGLWVEVAGDGIGDMLKATYDPANGARQVMFADETPTPYTLPTSSSSTLGGIKVGTRLSIDGSGVLSADVQTTDISSKWTKDGDTLGAKKTLGSIDNQDIGIITNNTERITVLKGGNVGIGTTTPNNKIQVVDLIDFNNTDFNTKIGYQAGKNLAVGANYNTYVGNAAGFSAVNSTGQYNVGIGYGTLYSETSGSQNIGIGYRALYANNTGYHNFGLGYESLYSNTGGYNNVSIGTQSLYFNNSGYKNISIGETSLAGNTTGYSNVGVGYNAGRYIANGVNNNQTSNSSIYLGDSTRSLASGDTNEIVIGFALIGIGSNSLNLANTIYATGTNGGSGGNVGIGTTAPTARLMIKEGTATAGTAPLKLTSGVLNTTAEAGAIEYLSGVYYATDAVPTRNIIAMTPVANPGLGTVATPLVIVTASLGTSQGSMTFIAGILVASTPAT